MSASGGVRREPTSSPVIKGVSIDRLDACIKQLAREIEIYVPGREDSVSAKEFARMIWEKL
jgi:hypothetical protein